MAEPSTSPDQNTTAITTTTSSSWGTLEELLLACAVHRYGTNSWDSIARELQNRTTFSLTPHICQQKYRDIKRRFSSDEKSAGDSNHCLDELRRLRVAELRRELQRYDLSIVSLQLKVKKLKEDRGKNVKDDIKDEVDLQKTQEKETEMIMNKVKAEPPGQSEPEPVEPVNAEPEQNPEPENNSCNGSSNSKEKQAGQQERKKRVNSDELVESVAESKDDVGSGGGEREEAGTKENSDVQSTASLWRNENNNGNKNIDRGKKGGGLSGTSSGDENQSPAIKSNSDVKSQPLIEFLEVVLARKLGSFFERRLESQENPKYKNLIRQHIDLGTIQRRLEEGQYTDCHTKFYRDVMLLINNALIFFSRKTTEHKAALELRQLLDKQFRPHVSSPHDHKSNPSKPIQLVPIPKPTKSEAKEVDLKPKLTITGPIIACRKRSSIAGKSSQGGEKKDASPATPLIDKDLIPLGELMKQQAEKTSSTSFNAVTKKRSRDGSFGSRSSSSKNDNSNPSPSTPVLSKGESTEAKADKKKPSPGTSSSKMKQSSGSGKLLLLESLKNSDRKTSNDNNGSNAKTDKRKDEGTQSKIGKEKTKGKEERQSLGNRSSRRPPKRAAAIAAMGKRGRDNGGEEPQPKKRQRK
ncbi:uncharacterized protein LOC130826308 [Amaranthus tricolor]|uniref:uncharacterized protein LOC130826308 n=1 Tax=Amaranthus tricolor TaxID=29722 RepID=UPI002583CD87|nr:uncharacterized protein LOC130826308 [Amaranthus tricolor]